MTARGDADDERTTGDLLLALDEDYQHCYRQILLRLKEGDRDEDGNVYADHELDARQLVRSAFAYIEGATYAVKIEASFNSDEKGFDLSPPEQYFIFEADFDLDDKGKVTEKPTKISLARNIRFAFSVFAKANGIEDTLDVSSQWWAKLREAIKVRDRLTHPRSRADLDVSPSEVIATVEAKAGFDEALQRLLQAAKT